MFELVLRIGFSLLVVFGLMWGLARLVKRPMGGKHGGGTLWVLNRQQLTRGSMVAVVQVADRALILGVTDQQINLLGETDLAAFEKHETEHRDHWELGRPLTPDLSAQVAALDKQALDGSALSPRTWRAAVDFLRDRTSRR